MKIKRSQSFGTASTDGFTLIEVLLAITLLAMMMGMIYACLNIGIRAWDTGDARIASASNWRTVEHFLRRELGQIFPTRWRGVPTPYIAFEGTSTSLRYVTALNLDAALQNGAAAGLQWAELSLQDGGTLILNRQTFDNQAQNFDGLSSPSPDQLKLGNVIAPVKLAANISALEISYFGSDTDTSEPTWRSEWRDLARLPTLLRIKVEPSRERSVPDIVVALKVGEEAGCLSNNFTRQCGPRPR